MGFFCVPYIKFNQSVVIFLKYVLLVLLSRLLEFLGLIPHNHGKTITYIYIYTDQPDSIPAHLRAPVKMIKDVGLLRA